MRKSRFCASLVGVMVAAAPFSGGLAPPASAQDDTAVHTLIQVGSTDQTWEERMREVIRRLRVKMGDPTANVPAPVKTSAVALRVFYDLHGLAPHLSAADLEEMSADAAELADCADFAPEGTDYSLVVFMHDLGMDLVKSLAAY